MMTACVFAGGARGLQAPVEVDVLGGNFVVAREGQLDQMSRWVHSLSLSGHSFSGKLDCLNRLALLVANWIAHKH